MSTADDKPTQPGRNWSGFLLDTGLRLRQWFRSEDAKAVAVSAVFHALLLVALSLIAVHVQRPSQPFSTVVSEGDEPGVDLAGADETRIEVPSVEVSGAQVPQLRQLPVPTDQAHRSALTTELAQSVESLADTLQQLGQGGGQEGLADGVGFRMPGSGKVVRKGRFAAWTVPEDPAPYEDYLIVVQVQVPRQLRNYDGRDLSGYMYGTDGYTTPIGFYRGRYYGKFIRGANQLVIRIPGAEKNVRDVIHVESRLLREKQELEIVF